MFSTKIKLLLGSFLILTVVSGGAFFLWGSFEPISDEVVEIAKPLPLEEEYPLVITKGTNLGTILNREHVSHQVIAELSRAAKPVLDFRQLRPGTRIKLQHAANPSMDLVSIRFRMSPIDIVEIKKENLVWSAVKIPVSVETRVVTFRGIVEDTLWESADQAKMDPNLIMELAEIFAWQVDFAREVRSGDKWRISVEQKFVNGESFGWGAILAAEYINQGFTYSAVLFSVDGKPMGYFAADGSSLRRMFLKSPIRFGRISSRFQKRRFHPILQTNRAHNGVDYAAPRGTPIRSVGNGTVTFVGPRGGGGNTIKIRHNGTYETAYKHLDGFAKGVRGGSRVEQGQVIGYVGTTGLSTAPHLHFEFYQSGRFVDPLGRNFPSADPVPNQYLTQFKSEAAARLHLLPSWDAVEISRHQTQIVPEDLLSQGTTPN